LENVINSGFRATIIQMHGLLWHRSNANATDHTVINVNKKA